MFLLQATRWFGDSDLLPWLWLQLYMARTPQPLGGEYKKRHISRCIPANKPHRWIRIDRRVNLITVAALVQDEFIHYRLAFSWTGTTPESARQSRRERPSAFLSRQKFSRST